MSNSIQNLYNSPFDMAHAALRSWARDPELQHLTMEVHEIPSGINIAISHGEPGQERHYIGHIQRTASPKVIEHSVWKVMNLLLCIDLDRANNKRSLKSSLPKEAS